MLVSWIKRRKMSKVNQLLINIQVTLQNCRRQLADVDRRLLADLPNTSWNQTFGIWLDNPLTDCCVIKEAKNLLQAVETLEAAAKLALAKLTQLITNKKDKVREKEDSLGNEILFSYFFICKPFEVWYN